jgi:diguanylate cyclase (GGDEF)-like protein
MAITLQHGSAQTVAGKHFSCSMTAVLLARVQAFGGPEAVAEVLQKAGSKRSPDYLIDIVNWISYDEAAALWRAGALVTHHPQFARAVGEDAARRLNGSPIAALLRSLGSPEAVYRQVAVTSSKYSVATRLEALDVGPGFAEIVAIPEVGFPRDAGHCAWTCGLLTQPTVLFGLPPATVEHEVCAALGAADCRYRVTWDHDPAASEAAESERNHALAEQIAAMKERLNSMFRTAADLIGADEIAEILARITERAAVEIRAPRYLLAIRATDQSEMLKHHKGFEEDEVDAYAERILESHPAALPESWLVVPVRSSRRDYGRLLALYDDGHSFFPEERELLEVYARYAASALDSSTALMEAKRRYGQSSALLNLARALAAAGTSGEVTQRLAEAVPAVVDCDRVAVYLWEDARGKLVRRAMTLRGSVGADERAEDLGLALTPGGPLEKLLNDPRPEPIFVDAGSGDPTLRGIAAALGAVATILVPLATPDRFLGLLAVSVMEEPERLTPSPDLLDRLSGVAAQATTALQNGRLLDEITHQALHDGLTGLANRLQFSDRLRTAVQHAREHGQQATLFYLDLDYFKPVNDEFGHDVGDELLIAVGARLVASTRSTDTVARLGGDEFAVLVDARTSSSGADLLADRLADVFKNPFTIGEHRFSVGASIGRAVFPADADSPESMLRAADAAMFECKRATHLIAPRSGRR